MSINIALTSPSPPIEAPVCAGVSPGTMLSGAVEASAASLSGAFVATSGSAMTDCVVGVYSEGCSESFHSKDSYLPCAAASGVKPRNKSGTRPFPSFASSSHAALQSSHHSHLLASHFTRHGCPSLRRVLRKARPSQQNILILPKILQNTTPKHTKWQTQPELRLHGEP